MPLTRYMRAREERRLIVLLYLGTLVLLALLLYATWKNLAAYQHAAQEVRRQNNIIIELEGAFSALQDQEIGARGFLLTNDAIFLDPMHYSGKRYQRHFTALDKMCSPQSRTDLDSLRLFADSVKHTMELLVEEARTGASPLVLRNARLVHSKWLMDQARLVYGDLRRRAQDDREEVLAAEVRTGLDAPSMIIVYSALALAATVLLFWRLFRSLNRNELMNLELNGKVKDLDKEVAHRRRVQGVLEKVQDTSPNGIMSFMAIRDASGSIVDFLFLSSNSAANRMVKRDDLVGKRLLEQMPENKNAGLFDAYMNVVETGKPYRNEFHYEGEGVDLWIANHAVKLDDGFMVTFSDTTEQRRAHSLVKEADRVALTGQITRTVAHEVRNPLTNIHLALEQLRDEIPQQEEATLPFFQIIQRNLERIGALIKGMLESSKKRELDLAPSTFENILEQAIVRVADRLRLKDMRYSIETERGLPETLVDLDLIELAITNIAINAVEAMEPGRGELRMRAFNEHGEVALTISDNGKGLAPENVSRLFEPFYSGRPGGLGLGLTTTRSILNSHGVALDVRSTPGLGTTFTLRFPPSTFFTATSSV